MSEILDLVDKNDKVIGRESRDEIYKKDKRNYRIVYLLIKNNKGEIFIPRRASTCKILPSHFDFSMGGHVKSGETYEQGCIRETKEELNIQLQESELEEVLHLSPYEHGVYCFMKIFEVQYDKEIDYNKADFDEAIWMTSEKIKNLQNTEELYKDDLVTAIKMIYK